VPHNGQNAKYHLFRAHRAYKEQTTASNFGKMHINLFTAFRRSLKVPIAIKTL